MRCASCGTENAPDSRFCGGCGARLSSDPPAPRLAPTHKISDDARWDSAQPTSQAPIASQQVARKHPGSAPPGTYQVPVRPPTNPVMPVAAPNSRPQVPIPMIMPPASSAPRGRDGDIGRLATEVPARAPTAPVGPGRPDHPLAAPVTGSPIQRSSGSRIAQPPQRASAKSLEPPQKRWGLIMLLVLIDLGLAAAGVVLLREGLREVPAPGTGSGSTAAGGTAGSSAQIEPAKPPQPPQPEPVVVAQPPPPAVVEAPAPPPDPPPATGSASNRARTTKIHVTNHRPPGAGSAGSGPLDPYNEPAEPASNLAAQIDRLTAHSKPAFDGCYTAVMKSMPPEQAVHGTIKLAFRVVPDGRVERVVAIENGTGSEPLAGCLVNEIGSWVLPSHPGDAVDFVRAFKF